MDENEIKKKRFQELCGQYLMGLSINSLRCYGRKLGISAPTKMKKIELVQEIVSVLGDDKKLTRTKRGAPIKNNYFQEEILIEIENMKNEIFGEEYQRADEGQEGVFLQFSVSVEKLNGRQRQLLKNFLDSL